MKEGLQNTTNATTDHAVYITQSGVLASGKHAIEVYSDAAQINSALARFELDNASSTQHVLSCKNDGTGRSATIVQTGVNAAAQHALIVENTGAQTTANTAAVYFSMSNASSTEPALEIDNAGTGEGLLISQGGAGYGIAINNTSTNQAFRIYQSGISATGDPAAIIYRDSATVAADAAMLKLWEANASTTEPTLEIVNEGTGDGIKIDQNGNQRSLFIDTAASTANGLQINSKSMTTGIGLSINCESLTTGSGLKVYNNDNSTGSGVHNLVYFLNDGTETGCTVLNVQNDSTGYGMYMDQNGVLAGARHALTVETGAAQVNASLAYFSSSSGSSTQPVVDIVNAGSGSSLEINQTGNATYYAQSIYNTSTTGSFYIAHSGVLGANNNVIYIADSAAQVNANSHMLYLYRQSTSSTAPCFKLENEGTGIGMQIREDNSSSASNAFHIINAGTGSGAFIDQNGNGFGLYIDNDGSKCGIYVDQTGTALAANQYGLYVYSNTVQTEEALVRFHCDNGGNTADNPVLEVQQDGRGDGIYIGSSTQLDVNSSKCINIVATGNVANNTMRGIEMNLNNSSVSGSALEMAFSFQGSEVVNSAVGGTQDYKIRVLIGSTTYYIPCHTA